MACLRKNPLTVGRIAHQVVDHVHFHVQLNINYANFRSFLSRMESRGLELGGQLRMPIRVI